MLRYTSTRQLSIEEFRTPFQIKLDKNNRWVKLARLFPWDEMVKVYHSRMNADKGRPAVDGRIVVGAMYIKHKLKLDDREVIEYIRENVYAQYFLGLSNYTYEDVFERSLFTTLRYRMGEKEFDQLNGIIIERAQQVEGAKKPAVEKKKPEQEPSENKPDKESDSDTTAPCEETSNPPANKGKLQLDATVADQMILYPTDLGLLNTAREESERLIDELHKHTSEKKKPRTYRRKARKQYLRIAKKKKKTKQEIRKGIGQQLRYLKRNLKTIHRQLDVLEKQGKPCWLLTHRDQKIFWSIQHTYQQQLEMYENRKHSVANRIVNIYQPYVRPIVRGKDKTDVEFGAKLGVSLQNGFARINTFSWEAYNESADLKKQVEDYKKQNGYYPEAVLADTIYGTRENRAFLKSRGIRFAGKPLGRPPKEELSYYQKRKQQKERNQRNHIEGKFGQGKNGYNLNKIRARQQRTSESWVSCIFFVMNIEALVKLAGKSVTDFLFFSFILLPAALLLKILPESRCGNLHFKPVRVIGS